MTKKVIFLRGVNVGGRNKLPMKAFAAILESLGCKDVQTYIQSGNAVCDGQVSAEEIAEAIEQQMAFRPHTFVMTAAALKKAAAACPYKPQAEREPKSVHLFFLDSAPDKEAESRLLEAKTAPEEFVIKNRVLYLHSPEGLAKSKIAEKADRLLKKTTTARNWNTIEALMKLAE